MSRCTFDREQLSLYVGDDLPPGERMEVEAHLAGCAECADVVEQYRGLGAGLRLALAAAPAAQVSLLRPFPARRPAWGALVAAAAVALLAIALVREPVLAAVQRWFQVHEVSPDEAREIGGREYNFDPARVGISMGPAAAPMLAERYGHPVSYPELGPGWEFFSVAADQAEKPTYLTLHYRGAEVNGPNLWISYSGLWEEGRLLVAEGMSQQVTVNGREAWLVRGAFSKESPTGYDEGDESSLWVRLDGQQVRISLHSRGVSREEREAELMRIAESIIK